MRKTILAFTAAVLGTSFLGNGAVSAATLAEQHHWTPVFTTLPARNVFLRSPIRQKAFGTTIPFYTSTVKSPLNNTTYTYDIVGANPTTGSSTTVTYVPLAIRVHFSNGAVLDPSQPGCGDTVSVENRFFGSPLFNPVSLVSNGVNVGTTQIIDGFQRAEFWKYANGTNYHVLLSASGAPKLIDVTAPSGSTAVAGVCSGSNHDIGEIDINAYDSLIRSIAGQYATPTQLPIILSYNVFQTQSGQCCILGYHSAYGVSGGTQTYSVGAYNDAGIFSAPIEDIHAWTHEIGEWANDPFVQAFNRDNSTPSWGHVGQVSTCQSNLEVGDPLTGTPFLVSYNGFTYHPQELAFFSWFYRTASTGTGGKFSFEGTFASAQGRCR